MFQKQQRPRDYRKTEEPDQDFASKITDSSLSEDWEEDFGGDEERKVPLKVPRAKNRMEEMDEKITMIMAKMSELDAENKSLKSQMTDVRMDNARMKEENKQLSARMSTIVEENEDLRRQIRWPIRSRRA